MPALTRLDQARVEVDPNSVVRRDPTLTAARFADADRVPSVGETVIASQPDEDGSDFAGRAVVVEIDHQFGLIYLRVDWSSFRVYEPVVIEQMQSDPVHAAASWRPLHGRERNGATRWVPGFQLVAATT